MGKSNNIFGAISGKIGGTIFYQRKNSKFNQGTRAYIADVKNPQSMGQARQRMTMKAVQNLYSALAEVINRAYQSAAYGNPSRIKFLGNAMKNFQGPWLEKGSTAVIPFAVNLAEGTLGQIAMQIVDDNFRSNLPIAFTGDYGQASPSSTFDNGEVGGISKMLLNAKGIVKEGDQLTIVAFAGVEAGVQPVAKVVSFIVDPNSVETIDDSLLFYAGESPIYLSLKSGYCAAAIIISREGLSGQHMRSTSPLVVNTSAASIAQYFTDTQYQQAILSYMPAGTRGDWPVEPDDDENIVKSYVTVTMSSAHLTFHPVAGGAAVTPASPILVELQGYRTPGGSLGLFENGNQNLYKRYQNNGGLITSVLAQVRINDTVCYVRLNTESPGDVRYVTVVG